MQLIVGGNGKLRAVGIERAAEGTESALVMHQAHPRRVTTARLGRLEDVDVGTAVAPVVLAAAAALRPRHDPLAALIHPKENHDVRDRGLAFGTVRVFPEKEVARLQVLAKKTAVGPAVRGIRHVPRLALEVKIVVFGPTRCAGGGCRR